MKLSGRRPWVGPFDAPRPRRSAFTLVELLVALMLSALVLQLILPLFKYARETSVEPIVPTWQSVLRADLCGVVSQSKCGVPVVRIRRRSAGRAFDTLEIQTFCRAGSSSRGPLEATYTIEPSGSDSGLALGRYGRGWHDGVETRHVLAAHVRGWELGVDGANDTSTSKPATTAPIPDSATEGAALNIVLDRDGLLDSVSYWVCGKVVIQ
jgi:prepilin-type N-terminal cleavage/methylation domain-containing protein